LFKIKTIVLILNTTPNPSSKRRGIHNTASGLSSKRREDWNHPSFSRRGLGGGSTFLTKNFRLLAKVFITLQLYCLQAYLLL